MPTYEYVCTSCGHHLEVSQSFSDEPLTACPSCGGPLRKVFGAVGIVLKGSGFYKTDNRTSSSRSSNRSEGSNSSTESSKEPAASSSDSSTKTESSPSTSTSSAKAATS